MSKWSGFFKVISPDASRVKMTDSQEMTDVGAYNNYTWYQRLIQGSASRMTRYREYDLMDNDVEVARALDSIAEEMTGNDPKTDEAIKIKLLTNEEKKFEGTEVLTIKAALTRWSAVHDWHNRLFKIARLMVKYGDVFFRKHPNKIHNNWEFIHPKNVVAAVVSTTDVTKVEAWQVKKNPKQARSGGYGMPMSSKQDTQYLTDLIDAKEIVRFTLNDDMSDSAPFGESVLRSVYRSHKQKELLEDAVIIYRVQRAPERRVFYIDVGKMPPIRAKAYLENIKNEIKQKKIPNIHGGQTEVDSVYNPQSMSEDFFFVTRPEGKGSKVESLPGGQGLGELSDLEYFQRKVWRGLRVPASYMIEQQEGGQIWNDGKVGVAYIQELRFALFVSRMQGNIENTLDAEFKKYLKSANIHIDPYLYQLRLPEPSNFGKYRQQELDGQLLNLFSSADSINYLSKRFILKRFLQLEDEEIVVNERMKREELQLPIDDENHDNTKDYPLIYNNDGGGIGGPMSSIGPGFGGEIMPPTVGGNQGLDDDIGINTSDQNTDMIEPPISTTDDIQELV